MKKLLALGILASSFAFADQPSEVTSIMQAPQAPVSVCEEDQSITVEPVIVEPIKDSYRYFCVGIGPLPIPAPLIGIGGRFQKGHHGFDGSLQVSSLLLVSMAKVNMNYLYYFKPNLDSQFYLGAGLSLIGASSLTSDKGYVYPAPQFVIGKQYTTKKGSKRHFQAEVTPWLFKGGVFPTVVLSYGFGF